MPPATARLRPDILPDLCNIVSMRESDFAGGKFSRREPVRITAFFIVLVAANAFSQAITQTQYSIGNPTNEQQYMLELINRARANGGAEATRLGLSGLQEGPPSTNGEPWTIQNSVQPLSWNPLLFNCAQNHATNLNTADQFFLGGSPHTFGGMTPSERIAAAGYSMASYNGPTTASGFFPGPENVFEAEAQGSGPFVGANLIAGVLQGHDGLFTDQTVPGRGHRNTTMLAFFREIGIGISVGKDDQNNPGQPNGPWDSLYIVQNFGAQTSQAPFITGAVYQDTNGNGFYDPGEGIGGIRVDLTGSSFFAVTSPSGGYAVPISANGSYTVTFSGGSFPATQQSATVSNLLNTKVDFVVSVSDAPTLLANISTRLRVETGDNALIGGFIVTGTEPKKVIVRAIGPSLPFGDKLANPTLELRDSSGALIAANDDWRIGGHEAEIIATTIPPSNDLESAIVETLPANNAGYTAIVRGVNNGTGIGLVEVYDLDPLVNSKLANISTRGLVQAGDNVLIAGTIVLGQISQQVIVRAIGPSLNVPGKLADPTLELRDANGELVRSNNDWRNDQEVELIATTIPPANDLESAIVTTLSANGANYTAIVRGAGGSAGIALVEIYAVD
jgi:SdrD B-like domain/Cysteine-rich secretory protein family